jgi:hypothetical protein
VRVSLEEGLFGAEGADATGRAPVESGISPDFVAALFGECSGGFLVSGSEQELRALGTSTTVSILGSVGGDVLQIECSARGAERDGDVSRTDGSARARGGSSISLTLAELSEAHGALAELFA